EHTVSTIDKTINVELYRPFNIDKDKIDIEIYNLFGNKLNTEIFSIEEIRSKNNNSLQQIDVTLEINENLTDGYYIAEVYYDDVQLLDDYYSKRIHVTGKPIIGRTWLDRFEDEKTYMYLTTFAETKNIEHLDGYKGYFYLIKDRRYNENLEYIGIVDLSIGKKDGEIGIIFSPEKFIDYPIGDYYVFIEDPSGEILDSTYFSIHEKRGGYTPEEPVEDEPIFVINFGATHVNTRDIILNIDAKGYSMIKIGNSEKELETSDAIAVKPQMNWILTEGDGEKTVYVQFLDNKGNSTEILSQTIILDTIAPKLLEASINWEDGPEIEGLIIGDSILINAKTNEKGKVYAVLYKDEKEVKREILRYDGIEEEVHGYGDWIQLEEEIDKIVIYVEDRAGNKSNSKVFDIKMGSSVQLSGYLYKGNEEERESIPYHDVYLYRNVDGNYQWYKWTRTDRYGYYEFESIPVGEYKIVSRGLRGYKDIEEEISVYQDTYGKNMYFESISNSFGDLTVVVKDNEEKPVQGANISIYAYEANISENGITNDEGKV
ncbi:MAG: hypothetical protein GXZ08_06455, partial [Tissierellia bacterium]|nr:hypothetical protein [Tissierellia bacterium]